MVESLKKWVVIQHVLVAQLNQQAAAVKFDQTKSATFTCTHSLYIRHISVYIDISQPASRRSLLHTLYVSFARALPVPALRTGCSPLSGQTNFMYPPTTNLLALARVRGCVVAVVCESAGARVCVCARASARRCVQVRAGACKFARARASARKCVYFLRASAFIFSVQVRAGEPRRAVQRAPCPSLDSIYI